MALMSRTTVTEHPKGEMQVKFKAFIERITWYSMGIVNIRADVDHQDRVMADAIGSGTACTWKGHGLILTAEHVIGDAEPEDIAFLLRVDDAIKWEG
jgi:S1-C subfamily serine protease